MYKDILKWVIAIISQPGKAWEMLTRKEEKGDEFLSRFVYPLIGLVTVAASGCIVYKEGVRHRAGAKVVD